ncbi:MAG: NAD(P)/FAD-dependent oxidoreductase [Chloracidobacterium sp.]|nr:NAD(P)/FAD-dependent oxidoreductase [Chloracidobacterium sp.]
MSITLRSEYEVAIVGAGPAGSSCAIRLAQSGVKVLLIEQKQFPRAKLCGEFISPECFIHFAELSVLDEMSIAGGVALERTVFYARNGRSATIPSKWFDADSHALGLSRAEMDLRLLNRARAAGVEILEETSATGLLFDNGKVSGVRLKNKTRETFGANSAITIDATGRAKILARQIEKNDENFRHKRADFVAFKTHLNGATIPHGDCEIYAYRGGYGGCNCVENNRFNLCFIVSTEIAKKYNSDASEILKKVVCENQRAAFSLRNVEIIDDWLAVPIESYGRAELAPTKGLLTIGDAAAFIDPFTGSGILLALESSKIAASVINDGLVSQSSFAEIANEYKRQYSISFDRRLRISSFVRHAAFVPFLAETVIKTLAMSDRLTSRLAKATRG